ncbi:MAG TPA: ribonuclease HI [Candidatus Limnocylindrales bacterium]|nr:ribonuclease HI [Candidatus Limnocylindrales bacterium]
MSSEEYSIYTDGACSGNPGPGGWAAVIIQSESIKEISGWEERSTNQRMELQAAIEALTCIPPGSTVRLHSDSAYLVNCFRQGWMDRWQKNGWQNTKGKPVENQVLWMQLLDLTAKRNVEWIKVKGHASDQYNLRCDVLARQAIEEKSGTSASSAKKLLASGKSRVKAGAKKNRRLGVLTGGGDCPGLNAVIRAVVKGATYNYDLEVIGFNNGFRGLVENDARLMDDISVSGILNRGGTILGTSNRDNPFNYNAEGSDYRETHEDRSGDALKHLEEWAIDCLIVIGGDGSLLLAHRFSQLGVPIIGIPKTIDNDLLATDVTFGFDSAVTTATEAIDKIHTTAESHHRAMVVEVMGRNAGWIALQAGMAGGGDIILIPEIPFDCSFIADNIMERLSRGKKFSIIVVAEGAHPVGEEQIYHTSGRIKRLGGVSQRVSGEIEKRTGIESRATVLGHLQRGGSPTSYDRVLATRFGVKAIELFVTGRVNEMVCLRGNNIESVPLVDVVAGTKRVDPASEQVRAAMGVGTSFGFPINH